MRWKAAPSVAAILLAVTACSAGPDVATEELSAVVQRDGLAFEDAAIPEAG